MDFQDGFPHNLYNNNNTGDNDRSSYKVDAFSVASVVCGGLSIVCFCTGIFSIFFGAMGILLAILDKRLGKPVSPLSTTGFTLSCFGLFLGIAITVLVLYSYATDEAYRSMVQYYQQRYSITGY